MSQRLQRIVISKFTFALCLYLLFLYTFENTLDVIVSNPCRTRASAFPLPFSLFFSVLYLFFSFSFFFDKIRRSSVFREILSSEMPGQRKLRITVNETIQGLRPERTASLCPNPEKLILLLVPSASPRLSCSRHRLVCNKIPCEPSDGLYCPSRSPPTIPHRNIWIPSRTGRTLLSRVKLEGPSKYTDIELWRQSIANYTG